MSQYLYSGNVSRQGIDQQQAHYVGSHDDQTLYNQSKYSTASMKQDKENIRRTQVTKKPIKNGYQMCNPLAQTKHQDKLLNEVRMQSIDGNEENQNPLQVPASQKLKPNNKISVNKPALNQQSLAQSPKPMFNDPLIQSYEFKMPNQHLQNLDVLNEHENHRNSQPPVNYYSNNSDNAHIQGNASSVLQENKHSLQNSSNRLKKNQTSQGQSHKKSQSLFNKKIVDIIAGLQQSLGVIANNVKNSFTNEELSQMIQGNIKATGQKKTLIESALLAQKLAHMTSAISSQIKTQEDEKRGSQKRRCSKSGLKTIEDSSEIQRSNSNRASIDFKQVPKMIKLHARTKSDLQNCRKQAPICGPQINNYHTKQNTIMSYSGTSIDHGQQSQVSALLGPQTLIGKSVDGNIPYDMHKSAKNSKPNSKPSSVHRQKRKEVNSISKTGNAMTIDQTRSSLYQKQTSGERLSDAQFISKMSKKCTNLFLGNFEQVQVQSKLKSAASSPSLHSHVRQQPQQQQPLMKKKKSQVFDFGQNSNLMQQNLKVNQKKKVGQNLQTKQTIQSNSSANSHKRSISDVSTLSNMFQFKQQMAANKALAKNAPQNNMICDSGKQQKHMIEQNKLSYVISTKPSLKAQQQVQIISSIASKRPSNDEENNTLSYNSPRQISQTKQPQQSQPQQIGQKDVYYEMKHFLKKFSGKELTGQIPAKYQKQILGIAQSMGGQTRTTASHTTGSTTQSFGSQNKGTKKSNSKGPSNKGSKQIQPLPLEASEMKRISQQYQALKTSAHKRVKSDAIQQFVIRQPDNNFKKVDNNLVNTKVFQMNMQPEQMPNPQMIYSARQSPGSTKLCYYNQEESGNNKKSQALLTNRSEKQTTAKFNQIVMSNQTTMKKSSVFQTAEGESQPFRIDDNVPRARLLYNNMVMDSLDERNQVEQQMYIGNPNTQQSRESFEYDETETNSFSYEEICKNTQNILSSHQSPKLKVLPTPKAIQPGFNFDVNQARPQTTENDQMDSKIKMMTTMQHNNSNQLVLQTLGSEKQFETFESNITANDHYSPRTKDKMRIIKQIKVSFNKLKEPIKTTGEFYRIGKMLGKGAFGRVNLAMHKLCEQLVAVKSINKQFLSEDENSKKKVMQEVLILQKTRHANIVKLYDSFETNKHIVFVMELCSGGDLLNYVRKRRKLKEDIAKYILKQVVEGLYYCHAKRIVHRDIKLDNLLLDEDGTVKLCDFGVSKHLKDHNEVMTEQCGTPAYIAPEILKDKGYKGYGVDIWSLGVCLYAMLYGTVPFKANNMSELHQLILKAKYSLKDDKVEISEDAKNLIRALLEPDPSKRLNIEQVKKHPWLQEAYQEGAFEGMEIFSEAEIVSIKKDFTYQDMARFKRNEQQKEQLSTEHFFTEHALDSTQNALLRNCTTKSVILAPFNSTRSHNALNEHDEDGNSILPPFEFDENMLIDRKAIKYAARVKDINRQYEMNNNQEVDNGVYNKFVRQSTNKSGLSQENSLVTSMNNEGKNEGPTAPLVSQNSEEDMEQEVIKKNMMQSDSELRRMQSQMGIHAILPEIEDKELVIDHEVVARVQVFGYPQVFIQQSLQLFEMNDASTSYFLLEKEKLHHGGEINIY